MRRCLLALDVPGIRRLWLHMSPHMAQPTSDDQALEMMHLARSKMQKISSRARQYSEAWLKERRTTVVATAVGISVRELGNRQSARTRAMEHAMSQSVLLAVRDGVDLVTDAAEVKRRMEIARLRA